MIRLVNFYSAFPKLIQFASHVYENKTLNTGIVAIISSKNIYDIVI